MDPSYLESPVVEGAKKLLAYFAVVSRLSFAHAQQSLLTRTAHTHTHTRVLHGQRDPLARDHSWWVARQHDPLARDHSRWMARQLVGGWQDDIKSPKRFHCVFPPLGDLPTSVPVEQLENLLDLPSKPVGMVCSAGAFRISGCLTMIPSGEFQCEISHSVGVHSIPGECQAPLESAEPIRARPDLSAFAFAEIFVGPLNHSVLYCFLPAFFRQFIHVFPCFSRHLLLLFHYSRFRILEGSSLGIQERMQVTVHYH